MRAKSVFITTLTVVSLSMTGTSWGVLTGSKHDFSQAPYNTWSGGQKCLPCHAPHNNKNAAGSTLWNHADTLTLDAGFTMYSSPGMTTLGITKPSGPSSGSRTCLSCHDGTTALDSYGANTGTNKLTGTTLLSTDLSNDHPISFTYDSTLAAKPRAYLVDPSSPGSSGIGTTIAADMLIAGKMECSSCHDVHNDGVAGTGMLKKSNAASGLCTTCHTK